MWFAVLDGLVVGAVVALALLRSWRRQDVGSVGSVLLTGVTGGVVGAGLGFTLIAASASTGPLQVTPLLAGLVGAVLTLVVLRQWTLGDRAAAVAAVEADRIARVREAKVARRAARQDARRQPRPPSALAELVVLGLAALRRRG